MVELDNFEALQIASGRAGLISEGAVTIKIGDNALYRLASHVVARVSRPGRTTAAFKEVDVARWLERINVPAVRVLDDIEQPIRVGDRCVTFWRELPIHRSSTTRQLATALCVLHHASPPEDFLLPQLDPFVGLEERLDAAPSLTGDERAWLAKHTETLREKYELFSGDCDRTSVIHGDAHADNIVTTEDESVVMLDFERVAIGPPEWDLVSIAVENESTSWCTDNDYAAFVEGYGEDVKDWPHYGVFRDIRELRMTCFVAELSSDHSAARDETTARMNCLRGVNGARPWSWKPM